MKLAAFVPIAIVISAVCVGCDTTDTNADINHLYNNACSSPDPVVDVEWVKELKSSLRQYESIVQGKYLSETVFYVLTICPNCSMLPPTPTLYDCSGTIIRKFNNSAQDQRDLKKLTVESVLYSCC